MIILWKLPVLWVLLKKTGTGCSSIPKILKQPSCLLNILELTGWPLCSPYESCSWGNGGRTHGWAQIQTLIVVNPDPIINKFSLLKLQHDWPNMIRILTMHQLVNTSNIKHFHPQVKIGYNCSFHEPSLSPYSNFVNTSCLREEASGPNNSGFHKQRRLSSITYQWWNCRYWRTMCNQLDCDKKLCNIKYYHDFAWDKHFRGGCNCNQMSQW